MQFLLIWFPGREGFLIAFRLFSGAGNREVCYQFALLDWVLEMESSKFARLLPVTSAQMHLSDSESPLPLPLLRMCVLVFVLVGPMDRWTMSMALNGISLPNCSAIWQHDYEESPKKHSSLLFTTYGTCNPHIDDI